jgi:diguanylate cyclase (GGDEF)-like protein
MGRAKGRSKTDGHAGWRARGADDLVPLIPTAVAVLCGVGVVVDLVLQLTGHTEPRWTWLACGGFAALACIQRGHARRYDSLGWFTLAGATIAATVARFHGTLVPAAAASTMVGRTAAIVYPILLVSSAMLVLHGRMPDATWAMRIEGASGFFGAAAVAAVLLGPSGRASMLLSGGSTGMAPALAALLAAAAVGGLVMSGGRGGRAGLALTAAMLCLSGSTIIGTVGHSARPALQGSGWALTIALIALAAALDDANEAVKPWPAALLDGSLAMGVVALGVVAWGLGHRLGPWATVPAILALTSVGVRSVLTRLDARALTDSRHQARTDDLTGLANRRYFYERVETALAGRSLSDPLAVMVIDLDRFKEINDSLGHHAGDEVLRLIGPRLAGAVSVRDVLARLGGDEFSVLIEGGDLEWVVASANRVCDSLRESFMIGDVQLTVDASVGVAMWPDHARTLDDLLARADIAMYRAKSERSGVRTYEERGDAPTWERLHLLELLRTALHSDDPVSDGLIVHYQPKLHVKTGAVEGVEALVRFDHPDGTLLFPDLFIAMVENAGLMMDLTLSVLRIAIRQCQEWRQMGILLNVAVNVSTSNLLDLAFPHQVMTLLKEFDLSPSALAIEVTESSLMQDRVRCLDVLHRLRAIGIKISVDDYGTGHSSLAYLRDLPADELKLDRTFVQGMAEDPKVSAIVESTVALAHALDLSIVAEGVETDEDLDRLRQFDVDVVQGYLFSRALSPEQIMEWFMESFYDTVVPPEPAIEAEAVEAPEPEPADDDIEFDEAGTTPQDGFAEPEFEIQGIDWIPLDAG